ncbi:MAG TPA: high-potential iron-sulfur protein [Steroidobacteraceae bacterium]|nr:high-potential iron-sulfur protein [Steroidobacteraceae bacterium]
MTSEKNPTRRRFVQTWLLGASLAPLALSRFTTSRAADQPLLSPDDPAAVKVKYTEDATKEKNTMGHKCATCALYEGTYSSTQGPCQIFPDKLVKAAGWCSSWAPQL